MGRRVHGAKGLFPHTYPQPCFDFPGSWNSLSNQPESISRICVRPLSCVCAPKCKLGTPLGQGVALGGWWWECHWYLDMWGRGSCRSLRDHTHWRLEPECEEKGVDLGPRALSWAVRGHLYLDIVFQNETPRSERNLNFNPTSRLSLFIMEGG